MIAKTVAAGFFEPDWWVEVPGWDRQGPFRTREQARQAAAEYRRAGYRPELYRLKGPEHPDVTAGLVR